MKNTKITFRYIISINSISDIADIKKSYLIPIFMKRCVIFDLN